MTPDQLDAIEDCFGKVAPVAEQTATTRGPSGLFADFMIAEAHGRSLAAQ